MNAFHLHVVVEGEDFELRVELIQMGDDLVDAKVVLNDIVCAGRELLLQGCGDDITQLVEMHKSPALLSAAMY